MTSSLNLTDQLKRIIYLCNVKGKYYSGEPSKYQIDSYFYEFLDSLHDDHVKLLELIDQYIKDKNFPRRSVIFLILAKLIYVGNLQPNQRANITNKVIEYMENDEDLFYFIKHHINFKETNKVPSTIQKVINKFYLSKTALELAEIVARRNKMLKWSHKDLIKLSHFKSDSVLKNSVINYILMRKLSDKATEEELNILNIMKKSDELKKCTESVDAIPIIIKEKFTMEQVSSFLHKNHDVWSAAIPNMKIQQILPNLLNFYKLNFLKRGTTISNLLLELLNNAEEIKTSRIHPIEIFCHLKKFEKGGKPLDINFINYLKTEKNLTTENDLKKYQTLPEIKCSHILNALWKSFELACLNLPATNKRYLLTIDVSAEAKNGRCIGNKHLTLLEAAVAYSILLLRVEKDVIISTYKDDETINILSVGKKISYEDLFKKIYEQSSTYSQLYSSVEWATKENKKIDVFVNFIQNSWFAHKDVKIEDLSKTKWDAVLKYRNKMNLPNAKFVTFAALNRTIPPWTINVELPINILDILGFDAVACKVVESFSKGTFS